MGFLNYLDRLPRARATGFALALMVGIGTLDYLTGYEYVFPLFYVLPITILTWRLGKTYGMLAAAGSTIVWLTADLASGYTVADPLIAGWNTIIRGLVFAVIVVLLDELRRALTRERLLARTDALTGAVNAPFFRSLVQQELDRSHRYRHPLALAYIDLDNFKSVNDHLGHGVGDQVLGRVVAVVRNNLRRSDVIARLGGDEFAVLLPETDAMAASRAVDKLRGLLLAEMQTEQWPVTFSIGVVTGGMLLTSVDELIRQADQLMYSVKADRKDGLRVSEAAGVGLLDPPDS